MNLSTIRSRYRFRCGDGNLTPQQKIRLLCQRSNLKHKNFYQLIEATLTKLGHPDAWKKEVRIWRWMPINDPLAILLATHTLFTNNENARPYFLGYLGKCAGRYFRRNQQNQAKELVEKVFKPFYSKIQKESLGNYLELEVLKALLGDFDAHLVPGDLAHLVPKGPPSYLYLEESINLTAEIAQSSVHVYIKRKAVDALFTLLNPPVEETDQPSAEQRAMVEKAIDKLEHMGDQIVQDQVRINQGKDIELPVYWNICFETPLESSSPLTPPQETFTSISDGESFNGQKVLNTHQKQKNHYGLSSLEEGLAQQNHALLILKIKENKSRPLGRDPKISAVAEVLAYQLAHYLGIPVPVAQIEWPIMKRTNLEVPRVVSYTAGTASLPLKGNPPTYQEATKIINEETEKIETLNLRFTEDPEIETLKTEYPSGTSLGLPEKKAYAFFKQAQAIFANAYVLDQIKFLDWIIFNEDAHVAGYSDFLAVRKKGSSDHHTLYAVDFGASFRCLTPADDPFNGPQRPEVHINTFKSSMNFAVKHPVFMEHVYPSMEKFAKLPDATLGGMIEQFRGNYLNDSQVETIKRILFEERNYVREVLKNV